MTCRDCIHYGICNFFDEEEFEEEDRKCFEDVEDFVSRKKYDELRGKYEHLKGSMQLVSSIKQTEEN